VRTSAASASKFPIKRRVDFIVSTVAMPSDPESLSDAEAFAGCLLDAARLWQKAADRYAYICRAGQLSGI
jgi:hypothetical protein